ncbi:MAG: hypothetical protein CL927_16830 [Deltaproteobacteria bacterium]|nr:hypothetical protein [Deltaproteobacteria bacterium]HCH66240.1 hypothetical protein [Deltaproteobacteria bacterium]
MVDQKARIHPARHGLPHAACVLGLCLLTACINSGKESDDSGDGDTGQAGSNRSAVADVLLVLDTSSSMAGALGETGVQASALIDALGLAPAADVQLALTTTTADDQRGDGLDPGEGGLLIAAPIDVGSPDAATTLREQVLCKTAFWPSDTPRTNSGEITDCSGPPSDEVITQEYLDCVCGFDQWKSTSEGSGIEEHLESALMALCRSVDAPPAACSEPTSIFSSTSDTRNDSWLRPDSTVHVVIVTDEGDSSRRIPQTGQGSDEATAYLEAFAQFDQDIVVSVIGPLYDPDSDAQPRCLSGAGFGGYLVDRFFDAVTQTDGLYRFIVEETQDGGCTAAAFTDHYAALAQRIRGE